MLIHQTILLYFVTFLIQHNNAQIHNTTHLSFNIIENENIHPKKIYDNCDIIYRINHDEFKLKPSPAKSILIEDIKNIPLIDIFELNEIAQQERKRQVRIGKTTGEFKLLTKGILFEKIYLYVQESSLIRRYEVQWIESIE